MKIKIVASILIFSQLLTSISYADNYTTNVSSGEIITARRGVATVILFGLGGAVLGLSTLSFYPRPQENLANISYGFILGLIGGGVYIVAQPANDDKLGLDPMKELHQRSPNPNYSNLFSMNFNF